MISHPATFSDEVLKVVSELVPDYGVLLDPFAGVGTIGRLWDMGFKGGILGIELEEEWAAMSTFVKVGDALDIPYVESSIDIVATSPTFGNRMADHHNAKDDSKRMTYRHQLGRALSHNNSGSLQWGVLYRKFHKTAWHEVWRVLRTGGLFVLNIKNHIRKREVQDVAEWHIGTLALQGFDVLEIRKIDSKGMGFGANHDARVDHEYVISFLKPY